jgi:hypothetical protein
VTGKFNDFAMRMANVVHRFQADQNDINAVWCLIENCKINPTVDVLHGAMPATASYSSLEEDCSS